MWGYREEEEMKRSRTAAGIILILIMIFAMMPASSFAVDGTIVEINDADGLRTFADNVNSGKSYEGVTVVLKNDIALGSDQDWLPIGNGTRNGSGYTGDAFKGVFEGNGKTISGLTVNRTVGNPDDALGLFGVVDGGTVRNLVLKDVEINVPYSECAGGVTGLMVNGASAEKITVSGSISAKRGNGGITGRMTVSGSISDCINNAEISAAGANAGGIAGAAYYTENGKEMSIKNCVNNGTVTNTGGVTGGIAGLSAANISNCENKGKVEGCGTSIGGIAGEQQNYGTVTECINRAEITNNDAGGYGTGGIIGWIRYNGSTTDYQMKKPVSVIGNLNTGTISGGNDGGGIVGTLYNAGNITGNENNAGSIKGKTFAAGIAGNIQTTETPAGGIDKKSFSVYNNVSATPEGCINGSCVDLYAYNNDASEADNVRDNADRWAARIGKAKYTTIDAAVAAAVKGDTIEILNADVEESIEVGRGIEVINSTDQPVTVNDVVIKPGSVAHGGIIKVDRVEAACEQDGNIEYWYCEQCGKYFSDKECTCPIDAADTVIAAKGHDFKNGVCTICGKKTDENGGIDDETDTGDDMNIWLPAVLIIAALAVAGILIFSRKKK